MKDKEKKSVVVAWPKGTKKALVKKIKENSAAIISENNRTGLSKEELKRLNNG